MDTLCSISANVIKMSAYNAVPFLVLNYFTLLDHPSFEKGIKYVFGWLICYEMKMYWVSSIKQYAFD